MTQGKLFSEFPAIDAMRGKEKAEDRRDKGMARAADHAETVTPDWNESAYHALLAFLEGSDVQQFLAEDFVAWTRDYEVAQPPDPRAWGAVIHRAAKSGVIRRIGYAPANSSNRSPKCLWSRT